jgi:hypothetical protein
MFSLKKLETVRDAPDADLATTHPAFRSAPDAHPLVEPEANS